MTAQLASPVATKPRLGFLGLGWIGRNRLQSIIESGCAEVGAVADSSPEAIAPIHEIAPDASICESLDQLLESDLDGLVIATPSALHAEAAERALDRGLAVFCQKPLGRNAAETRRVVAAARQANRLLAVDLSYRYVHGVRLLREWVQSGELGEILAIDATFHNAYGPNKPWFFERSLSGGGCLLDLGIHLVDLAFWIMDWPAARPISSRLFCEASPLIRDAEQVEDYAAAHIDLANTTLLTLACSWNLSLGRDANIAIAFYGSKGGAALKNVNGSFFDFTLERYHGTNGETFDAGDRSWFGAAAADWARRLQSGERFDPESERLVDVATVLDEIYAQGGA